MAVILGTIAAVVMVRFGRFRGSNGFAFMITAPLVMPDVITGLSLLLLFVALAHAIGWPADRNADHLAGARHLLYSVRSGGDFHVCANWIIPLRKLRWILAPRR